MKDQHALPLEHLFQKEDDDNCGPCCLSMVYSLREKKCSLKQILNEMNLDEKGESTYSPQLARHLLQYGFQTKLIISNSRVISPAWSSLPKTKLIEKLKDWIVFNKGDEWLTFVAHTLFYLQEGGEIELASYNAETLKNMLDRKSLLIVCVDAVWLWGHRFKKHKAEIDELRGKVHGHFVLVTGYKDDTFAIFDPYPTKIKGKEGVYHVNQHQLVNASLTWAATTLEIQA